MSADRPATDASDVESVEEPTTADRTPPPDTPGLAEGPSRADSRTGAAAANAGPCEQQSDPVEKRDAAQDLDRATTAARPQDKSTQRLEPLTDREYTEHTDYIESSLAAAVAGGEATDVKYTVDAQQTVWRPDRAKLHREIVDDLYTAAGDVPNDGEAILAGGLGGAGKSTTLDGHAGVDRSKYLTINPDDIKESLARRGMIPTVKGLAPMERSALVHEESSDVATALAARAYAERKNVIWDITMSSRSSVTRRLQQLRDAGYRNIHGIFVQIPVETSVERAQARHRRGLEEHRNGEGLGGRYVPAEVIRANADSTWGSVNRGVFEEMKPQFDSWKLYDNSVDGRGPVLLGASDGSERDEDE